jgi:hypothetical protein
LRRRWCNAAITDAEQVAKFQRSGIAGSIVVPLHTATGALRAP